MPVPPAYPTPDVTFLIPELPENTWFSLIPLHQPTLPPTPPVVSLPPTPDRVREMEHINQLFEFGINALIRDLPSYNHSGATPPESQYISLEPPYSSISLAQSELATNPLTLTQALEQLADLEWHINSIIDEASYSERHTYSHSAQAEPSNSPPDPPQSSIPCSPSPTTSSSSSDYPWRFVDFTRDWKETPIPAGILAAESRKELEILEHSLERQEQGNDADDEYFAGGWSSDEDEFGQRLRTEEVKEHVNEMIREAVSDLADQIMEYLHDVPYFRL
ncbi:hypothetical protein NLI96_g12293 [Meripilus lineatus]|uniref:Uncharacterized protein n=1 Tax=Meripilus lineatus TaxID=2056292 RepID=A0AAD5URJ7_9APHY|nr:hypothetical protein NLI96_g12293 [Physisporinus lineatus]